MTGLTILGGSYLFNCFDTLTSPNVPIRFDYKSPGGNIELTADTFSYNIQSGNLYVFNAQVKGPNGVIAKAARLSASGILLNRSETEPIRVSLFGSEAYVRRTRSGRLEIQDFLPKSQGPAGKLAFSVRADSSHLVLIDGTGSQDYRQEALIERFSVDGVGDEWIAGGSGTLDKVGHISASLQNVPAEGLYVRGNSAGLDLGSLLQHFRFTPEGRKFESITHFHAASLRAAGPFSMLLPKNKALSFSLQLTAHGTNLSYDNYKFERANFDGVIGEAGLAGKGTAQASGLAGSFDGSLRWKGGVQVGAKVDLRSASVAQSPEWLRNLIPREIQVRDAHYAGWIAYDNPRGITVEGALEGTSGVAYGEALSNPKLLLHVDRDRVRLGQMTASWHGNLVSGSLAIGLKDHKLAGVFSSPTVDLRSVASRFKQTGINGLASASVLLAGTTTSPQADFQANGTASYKDQVKGRFQASGRYADKVLILTRGLAETGKGTLVVDGQIGNDQRVGMRLQAANLTLAPFLKGAEGAGSFKGRIDGTLKNPRAYGDLQAYGLSYHGHMVPFASAHVDSDSHIARLTDFVAQQGPTEARGNLTYRYRDGLLGGKFEVSDLQPSEFLGEDVVGLVDLPSVTVGGTLKSPRLSARAEGSDLFYQGRRMNRIAATVQLRDNALTLENLSASLFDGTVSAVGTYDVTHKTGDFSLVLTDLGLTKLAALPPDSGRLDGKMSGTAAVHIAPDGSVTGNAKGDFDGVAFNDTQLGGGDFDLSAHGSVIEGSAQVGNLDGYQRIDHFAYDRDTDNFEAKLLVANTPLFQVYRATRRFYTDLPPNVLQLLRSTEGTLNVEASLHGPAKNPAVDLQTLDVTDLTVSGRQTGELKVSGQRVAEKYENVKVAWNGPAGNLKASGSVDPNRLLALDADLSEFDLSILGLASDSLAALRGKVTVNVLGSGSSRDPAFHASINSIGTPLGVVGADGEVSTIPDFAFDLYSIDVHQSTLSPDGIYRGGIDATGRMTFRGLEGKVTANVPLLYPFKIPENSPLMVGIDLPSTKIQTLQALIPGLDAAKTDGDLVGHIGIHGPWDNLLYEGGINLVASRLGFQGFSDRFHDVRMDLNLVGDDIKVSGGAAADKGGSLTLDALAKTPGVRRLIEELQGGPPDELWASPLSGVLMVKALNIDEVTPGKGRVSGVASGQLNLGGSLSSPLISGKAALANGKVVLPTDEIKPGTSPQFSLDPRFDISVAIAKSLNVRSSAANIDLGGTGSLAGSLKSPLLSANLVVQKGTFRLPTAKVTLEPDGTVKPSFHPGSPDGRDARIDVDLEGRTRVTAKGMNDRPQLYDIRMSIHGDLLQDGGLNLTATSNPPDLNQDQILAMIGQADTLRGLTTIGSGGQTESRIRSALAGFALPSLLDPITGKIGEALGLESLTLTYDLNNQASIAFAKALGKDFTIVGSRQLTQPIPGLKTQYDLELSYRSAKLRRFTFSIGADQDHPFKLSIEYGFRF